MSHQAPKEHDQPCIVVGYTTRGPGRSALERGIAEARLRDARLVVVHSMKHGPTSDREIRELHEHEKALQKIDRRLTKEGLNHRTTRHVRGMSSGEDLAETAREEGASLLVVGYRPKSRVSKALLGSDIQRLLLEAPCPVLAVKSDQSA